MFEELELDGVGRYLLPDLIDDLLLEALLVRVVILLDHLDLLADLFQTVSRIYYVVWTILVVCRPINIFIVIMCWFIMIYVISISGKVMVVTSMR